MTDISYQEIFIIAGEASGDAQGSLLISALKEEFKGIAHLKFLGAAGPLMRANGVEAIVRVEDLAVMGFTEILSHYTQISNCYKKILQSIIIHKPIAVIFIDYPGFNLKLIQDVYLLGITTVYHIPPKTWSHGAKRNQILKNFSHLITNILPFEADYFKKFGIKTHFIGNPLKDQVDEYLLQNGKEKIPFQIGLIPGSRLNEIYKLLPLYIEAFIELEKIEPRATAAVPVAKTLNFDLVKTLASNTALKFNKTEQWIEQKLHFGIGNAYEVMNTSVYAWVCSGTATLETAFFNTPMSVIYKMSPLSYYFAKKIITIKYISLVNLITKKPTVPELIQENANCKNLVDHALLILNNKDARQKMENEFENIKNAFPKNSIKNAAQEIFKCIQKYNIAYEKKFRNHKDECLRYELQ